MLINSRFTTTSTNKLLYSGSKPENFTSSLNLDSALVSNVSYGYFCQLARSRPRYTLVTTCVCVLDPSVCPVPGKSGVVELLTEVE
jgi:hypothetical protein